MPSIDTTALQTMITNWLAALVADSVNPQPTIKIDGREVSNQEWRDGLLKSIADASLLINKVNTYVVVTKQVLC